MVFRSQRGGDGMALSLQQLARRLQYGKLQHIMRYYEHIKNDQFSHAVRGRRDS